MVFIMCHGRQLQGTSVALCAKDGDFVLTTWVLQQFVQSPFHRAGQRKPKMFFFQACRYEIDIEDTISSEITSLIHISQCWFICGCSVREFVSTVTCE